ncbi:hypothetical protein C8R45DRAFT_1157647, partial [Mycena sanguinolenta]
MYTSGSTRAEGGGYYPCEFGRLCSRSARPPRTPSDARGRVPLAGAHPGIHCRDHCAVCGDADWVWGVKTLTDASVRNCDGDSKAFRPFLMVGIPAVWETIRKGIIGQAAKGGKLKENVFKAAVVAKERGTPVLRKLADSVILSSVRAATAGRLRIAMSGGAAISRETQEVLSVALVMLSQGAFPSR